MKALRIISALVSVFIVAPIWYYLLYKILVAIEATELMFFLYYAYLPISIFTATINQVIQNFAKETENK